MIPFRASINSGEIIYTFLDPFDRSWLPAALQVYVAAMNYSPAIASRQKPVWLNHVNRSGFTAVGAYYEDNLIGIVYGFPGVNETGEVSWWYHQLQVALRSLGKNEAEIHELTRDYFELTELHVLPEFQGRGVGNCLLHLLLSSQSNETVLLSTPEIPTEDNRAWRLYRRNNFYDVIRDFVFPGDERRFAVLGATLPLG